MTINQITPNQLDIIIFDVEHGNCAFIQTPSGETMMIDCGHRQNFSPAKFIAQKGWANPSGIETVVISHHDSDHISDYEIVVSALNPKIYHNTSIPLPVIEDKSEYQIGDTKHKYINHRKTLSPCDEHNYTGVEITRYYNDFKNPGDEVLDVNYHSIITFIKYGKRTICFPGDITNEGLADLIKNDTDNDLMDKFIVTDIFITPHHGRMSEKEKEDNALLTILLKHMKPSIIISSDKKIDETNENTVATNYYKQFAQGIPFNAGTPTATTRKVFTTRQDNTIHIAVSSESFYLTTDAFKDDIDNHIKNSQ